MSRCEFPRAAVIALGAMTACRGEVTLQLFEGTAEDASADIAAADSGDASGEGCRKLGAEVCNGGDDDCNGGIDEGCNYTVVYTGQPDGPMLGHAANGVQFFEYCPDGSILTGVRVAFGSWLNQVSAACSQIELDGGGPDAGGIFSLALGARFTKPLTPAVSQDPANSLSNLYCPEGSAVSALQGNDDPTRHILAVGIRCARPIVNTQSANPVFDLDRSQEQAVGPIACATCPSTQTYNFEFAVPPGQVAKRLFGGVSAWVNRFGFGTSVATVMSR